MKRSVLFGALLLLTGAACSGDDDGGLPADVGLVAVVAPAAAEAAATEVVAAPGVDSFIVDEDDRHTLTIRMEKGVGEDEVDALVEALCELDAEVEIGSVVADGSVAGRLPVVCP